MRRPEIERLKDLMTDASYEPGMGYLTKSVSVIAKIQALRDALVLTRSKSALVRVIISEIDRALEVGENDVAV